jgi:tRNA threonylcarbamoyladenosine biosynthesis protein TsaE
MTTYTLKKDELGVLKLIDKDGAIVPLTTILSIHPQARTYAFNAPMGAGKTTFISELCREMGTNDVTNSPTFAIVNVYELNNGDEIYHFDCYRLKDIREALDFGAEEYLYSGNYCFIEWPDVIADILPQDTVTISIRVREDGTRSLIV